MQGGVQNSRRKLALSGSAPLLIVGVWWQALLRQCLARGLDYRHQTRSRERRILCNWVALLDRVMRCSQRRAE
jgi:hypothetical protein